MPAHIRRDDLVMVMAGGGASGSKCTGKVLRVIKGKTRDQDKVIVEGVNLRKRHRKATQQNPQGHIVEKEMPIHVSNVMPVVEGQPTRVRYQTKEDGSKVRVAARDGQTIGPPLKKARRS